MFPAQFLDLRTLLTSNVASMLICFVVMAAVWRSNRGRVPATSYWLRSLGIQFVSFQLFLLRGTIPDALSIVVAAWLVTTGLMQLLAGLALFLDRPLSLKHDYVLQTIFVILHAYFTYADPSLFWRCINYSAVLTWFSLECVWLVLRTPAERRLGAQFLGGVMIAYALLFAGRIIYYVSNPPGPDFFHASAYDLVMYLGIQVLAVSLTFSFVLMVNRRLHHDLSMDIEKRRQAEEGMVLNISRLARAELASKTGNWELHLDTRTITSSPGAVKIYGLSASRFDYEAIKTIPLPEYRPALDAAIDNLIQKGLPYNVEFRIKTADTGELKDIHSIAEFNPAQRTVFGIIRDITEEKRVECELERLAQIDPLTSVLTRRHFMTLTSRELANATRYGSKLSVLMLDIDYFKQVNDTYGHQTGDTVLQRLGEIFHSVLREVDIVGRFGGEEFAVVLPQTPLLQSFEVAERLRRTVECCEIPREHGLPVKITVSIGITELDDASDNIDTLLARADKALYDAKHQGRNQVCAYEIHSDLQALDKSPDQESFAR
ncbi:sensor domain-containing diguanylate cyclase [Propionivibrio limicola]|uniref:sensor domain-containing diguanylate cyclase n=1 Tax=Propionivibrio limicola TaxID=167645 RepID=UPI0014796AD9|nr:diguanylate cyclase [Propionivibrio limicola]